MRKGVCSLRSLFHRPDPRILWLVGGLALLVHGLVLASVWFPLQAVMGLVWAGVVPGALGVHLLLSDDQTLDIVERALLAAGLGYASLVLGTLILHFLPGPLTRVHLLVFYDLLVLPLLVLAVKGGTSVSGTSSERIPVRLPVPICGSRQVMESRTQTKDHRPHFLRQRSLASAVVAISLVAAFFRLPNLGYSEFQGDEAKILVKAAATIQGIDDALFLHNKGPAEILVTAFVFATAGRVNEALARLPFTLANLSGTVALLVVGRRYFDWHTGWWAAILIALNGYFVAFARIVQYQSLVFLMSCLAMLCAHRLWQGGRSRSLLILMALFAATGLLAHYDAAFMLLPMGFVLLRRWLEYPLERRQILRWAAVAAIVLIIILGLFYVPYLQHPHFATTVDYISRRAGGYPPYANFRHFFINSTIYNSVYYVGLMVVLLVGTVFWRFSRITSERHWLGWVLMLLFGAAILSLMVWPEWWSLEPVPRSWSGALFGSLLLVLFGSKANSVPWKAVLLWFAGPFLLYTFLISDPRTHLYIMFPAWALLGSQGLTGILQNLKQGTTRWLAQGMLAGLLLLSSVYIYWMFVQHMVEVKRTYPRYRLPIYWTPYGDRFPKVGLFGFPYRAGWKVIGELYADGTLNGDYSSNEEPQITLWYSRGAFRCEGEPRYYFIAEQVQDSRPVPRHKVEDDYELVGVVQVDNYPKMRIYEREPASLSYSDYRLQTISAHYDSQVSGWNFDTALGGGPPTIQHPASLLMGEDIEFLGYDLQTHTVAAGDPLCLALYWRARRPIAQDYKVFVHLAKDGHFAAQKDGQPGCWQEPTISWIPGDVIVDPYCLVTEAGTPAGEYTLRAGLYLPETAQRLDVSDRGGIAIGNAIELGRVKVVEG
jgi:4-amino-4-deoxy-L-arabinose transferase-like glycosyltransferase